MAVDKHTFLNPKTLSRLDSLELRAREVVEGYMSGMHRSPYHGFSVEFAQHRQYAAGDDLRYVDWKVYGKTDKVYLKQFEEETNLICYLVLDASASMTYQSPVAAMSKLQYAQTAAASLAYLVLHQQDSVGLTTFDDQVRDIVPASSAPAHLRQVIYHLEATAGNQKTKTGKVLHQLAERLGRRGVVVVLSDLFDDLEETIAGLKHLRHRRHDVIVMQVVDPAEIDFPFDRPTRFVDLEGLGDVPVDPQSLRKAYVEEIQGFLHGLSSACRAQRMDYVLLRTDRPLEIALSQFLATRMKRRR